jgi:hypothetical protein
VPLPDRARFFLSQMQVTISRACNELVVRPCPAAAASPCCSGSRSATRPCTAGAELPMQLYCHIFVYLRLADTNYAAYMHCDCPMLLADRVLNVDQM